MQRTVVHSVSAKCGTDVQWGSDLMYSGDLNSGNIIIINLRVL